MSITMIAPAGLGGTVNGNSQNYTVGADGTIANVASQDVLTLLRAGFRFVSGFVTKTVFRAPLPADTTSSTPAIVSPVTPSNGALTIAAQPPHARKLLVQIHIGTTTTTAITAGTVTLVGTDQDGNAVSDVLSLVKTATAVVKTAHAYAALTPPVVAGYAASGSGTGNTVGIGCSNDFGVPTAPNVVDFALLKSTCTITTFTPSSTAADVLWALTAADDAAASATVDPVARTVAPTTAPGAAGINDYEFTCFYDVPG